MNLKDKRILVTGGHGFLGSALVPMLKKEEPTSQVYTFRSKDCDLRKENHMKDLLTAINPDIVIHLAVDGGGIGYIKDNPGSVYYNNMMMNTNLLEQCRLKGIEKFVGIGSVCFPKGTKIISDLSYINIEDVKPLVKVLTHDGTFQKVLKTFKRQYKGELIKIKASGMLELSSTPEHPFLVGCLENDSLSWKKASELKIGDYLFTPLLSKKEKKDNMDFSKELCELVGIFLAEGSVYIKDTGKRGSCGTVYFSFGENQKLIKRTRYLMKQLFKLEGHLRKMKGQEGYQLYFYDLPAARFFSEQFYDKKPHHSYNKIFPKKCLYFPDEKLFALIRGYFAGDGCFSTSCDRKKINFTTVSEKLVWQLKLILNELGIYSHIYKRKHKKEGIIQGRVVSQRQSWAVWVTCKDQVNYLLDGMKGKILKRPKGFRGRFKKVKNGYLIPIFELFKKDYIEEVFNLEVEKNNTYLVNGITVHNCAYPKFTDVPFKEEDLWKGYPEETNAPYGLAKKMMMVQGQSYKQQYDFNAIHLLLINLYGPGDDFSLDNSHVIPALIRKVIEAKENKKESVMLWGTGNASREFLYVDDCADAIIKAVKYYDKGDPVNIGTGDEITIRDLTHKVKDLVGYNGGIMWDISKPDGQPRRCLDTSKAEKEFGFKAKTSLDKGLKKTIEWYITNR